jgi:ferredoxin
VTPGNDRKHLPKWFDDTGAYDLVLDLQPTPSFAGDRLPIGYYAPGSSLAALDEAMAELPEMRGRFKKPQFISFSESLCFRGRSRARDCRRCLEVCPVGAIQSADRKLVVNHYLCQGCGGCALTCPADAIRVVYPPQEELLNRLHRRLESSVADAEYPPSLVISDSEPGSNDGLPGADKSDRDHRVYFEVEQIAHVRPGVLLTALACGAGDILVACGPFNSPSVRKAMESHVCMARAVLRALGLPEGKIRFAVIPAEDVDCVGGVPQSSGLETQIKDLRITRATFSPGNQERTLVRLATQHLYDQSGAQQASLTLPVGSPFGAMVINTLACTLCTACVRACPSGALFASDEVPRILFRESRCHQCGLCEETCPEGAIRLLPRLLCDPEAVETPVVLHEAEPLRCVECGAPFASRAIIDRIRERLTGHWMYANEPQLRRLQMCRTCSARDALGSPEMKSWNL